MAAALAAQVLGPAVIAQSAGLHAREGDRASPHAVTVMDRRGIDLRSHKARPLTEGLIANAGQIVAMTVRHKQSVQRLYPEHQAKVYLWSEWEKLLAGETSGKTPITEIADPWGGPLELYEYCAAAMEEILRRVKTFGKLG